MPTESVEEIKANLKSQQQIFSIVTSINSAITSNDCWFNTISDPETFLEKSSSEAMEIFVQNFLRYFESVFNEGLDVKDIVESILHIKNNHNFSYSDRRRARVFFEKINDILEAKKTLTLNEDTPNDWD
jgi:hypothetical protein